MDCPSCGAPAADGSKFCQYCGMELTAAKPAGPPAGNMPPTGFPPQGDVPPEYAPPPHSQWVEPRPQMTMEQRIVRYFIHGVVFSILNLVLVFVWGLLTVGLVIIGLFFGLTIAVIILFLMYGALNAFITEAVWKVSVKKNLLSIFLHGVALFLLILVASIPAIILQAITPSIVISIVVFIIYCFIDGFIARQVAQYWEVKPGPQYYVQAPPPYRPY